MEEHVNPEVFGVLGFLLEWAVAGACSFLSFPFILGLVYHSLLGSGLGSNLFAALRIAYAIILLSSCAQVLLGCLGAWPCRLGVGFRLPHLDRVFIAPTFLFCLFIYLFILFSVF